MATLRLRDSAWRHTADGGRTPSMSVPMRYVIDSGLRPVIQASVEGVALPMLVHANAGFVAMLTHQALTRITGQRVDKETEFGLGHDLQLSDLGRGHATVASLEVAGLTLTDPRIEVFDLPTINWDGMLGVEWLAASQAIVDFGRSRLFVPRDEGERETLLADASLLPALHLRRDPYSGRFLCALTVGSTQSSVGGFVVSTVAETTLDIEHARSQGIAFGEQIGEEHGPSGAVVPTYRATDPVTFYAAGRRSLTEPVATLRPEIYDVYGYGESPRPAAADAVAGYIGADLLVAHHGIIDFGDADTPRERG